MQVKHTVPFFAFGEDQKSSLIAQFCRQNNYIHIKNPIFEVVKVPNHDKNQIIEGSIELFKQLEPIRSEMRTIFVGTKFTSEENQIRHQYRKIGKCIQVQQLNYELFRKQMYPNLIFFYGPSQSQNYYSSSSIVNIIGYEYIGALPQNANSFIKDLPKTTNYIVNGLFTSKAQITILQQFFNIKVVHFQYNRVDLPQRTDYFDSQYEILQFLKSKPYYIGIKGQNDISTVCNQICTNISPQLIYLSLDNAKKRQYIDDFLEQQGSTLLLSILEVQSINKRKNIPLADNNFTKMRILNSIIYKKFNIKKVLIFDFPHFLPQLLQFQLQNKKFSFYVDLVDQNNIDYSKQFNTQMYFLQNQKRIKADLSKPLKQYLNSSVHYWLINGVAGSGKTTLSKQLASDYGFKLIQYEPYLSSVKQKLITPEDGQQLPFKKILQHFKTLLRENFTQTYVIDGLPFDNKDLQEWIKVIGTPSIINLEVTQLQGIKRTRKKNQADVNAQVNQQELNKAKQSLAKSQRWLQKVRQLCPTAKIHELNYNFPLIICQKSVQQLFKKNVYLVQDHNSVTFQNIALKYNYGFINLHSVPLRQCLPLITRITQKDLIICYYKQTQEKMISQDLYWIEKNIGQIRYLAIWQPEEVQIKEDLMELKKPQPVEKPKVQGAQGGQQKPPEEQASNNKKNQFNIYNYEWTKPLNPKNLSQWFNKSKKNISKVQSANGKQLFNNWITINSQIEKSNDSAVYQTFK